MTEKSAYVNILGNPVKLEFVTTDELKAQDRSSDELHGLSVFNKRTIYINSEDPEWMQKRTVVHEIVHFYFALSGRTHEMDANEEETICTLLENFVTQFEDHVLADWLGDSADGR